MAPRMIGASNQRTRLDMTKPEPLRGGLEVLELSRAQIAIDFQLLHRGLEILAECDNVDLILTEIVQRREHFVQKLPDAEHHSRLRQKLRPELFGAPQNPDGCYVAVPRPNFLVQ